MGSASGFGACEGWFAGYSGYRGWRAGCVESVELDLFGEIGLEKWRNHRFGTGDPACGHTSPVHAGARMQPVMGSG
jgi:hypothetical protein